MLFQIDHFGFAEDRTFKQRYLLADQHWKKDVGSILFYTGNEGDISWFANNTVQNISYPVKIFLQYKGWKIQGYSLLNY